MRTATTGAQAVDRAASLLVHVLRSHEPVTFPELVAATGLPKSTVSRLLGSLERNRLVARTQAGEVVPGDVVTAFARRLDPHDDIAERARPALERLSAATGETVNLAIGAEGGVIQIDQIDARYLIGAVNWLDREVPYHASASGKALLAHGHPLPSGRLTRLTERTRTTPARRSAASKTSSLPTMLAEWVSAALVPVKTASALTAKSLRQCSIVRWVTGA